MLASLWDYLDYILTTDTAGHVLAVIVVLGVAAWTVRRDKSAGTRDTD